MRKIAQIILMTALILTAFASNAFGQKLGYLNSQEILEKYKAAQDVKSQLEELNKTWEQEALNMQREVKELSDQLEAQRLLLSESKRAEKAGEIQTKYAELQQ